jgi:prophage antirepressor-like protein
MSNIIPFDFEGVPVRVVDQNGDPWWVLVDVCRVLELKHPSSVATRLDDDEKETLRITEGSPGAEPIIISEPGLYKVIQTSRKPAAKRFDRWVRHEVLPSIRKTGSYGTPASVDFVERVWKEQTRLIGIQFATVGQAIDEVKVEVRANTAAVVKLEEKVASLAPRRQKFSKKIRTQYAITCDVRFDGKCCCGCGRVIMKQIQGVLIPTKAPDEHVYRIDHLNGRHRNGPRDGLPVHKDCNQEFENNPSLRERLTHRAAVFHEEREKLFRIEKVA